MILHQYIVVIIVFALLCFMARWGYLLLVNYFHKDKPVKYDIVLRKESDYDKHVRHGKYDRTNKFVLMIGQHIDDRNLAAAFSSVIINYMTANDLEQVHCFLSYRGNCGGCIFGFGKLYKKIEKKLGYA